MSAGNSILIANAMVDAITEAALLQTVTAARRYVVDFDLKEMTTARVSMVPSAVREAMQSRGTDVIEIDIDVAVQKRAITSEECDALMALTDQIVALFRFVDIGDDTAKNTAVDRRFIYDQEGLQDKRLFTSIATMTFKLIG